MKKLVIAAIAVAASFAGHAEILGVLDMKHNAELKLSDLAGGCDLPFKLAYIKSRAGTVELTGCWTISNNDRGNVIILYRDNTVYTYPLSGFRADRPPAIQPELQLAPPSSRPPAKGFNMRDQLL